MKRASRILLWGGLAILVFSIPVCTIAFIGGIATGVDAGDGSAAGTGGAIGAIGIGAFFGSLFMIGTGALIRAFVRE